MDKVILHSSSENEFREMIGSVVESVIEKKLRLFTPELQQHSETNEYGTRREVSAKVKVSLATLNNYTQRGILKGYRIGGRILYKWSEVEQALQRIETIKYKRRA